MKDEQAYGLRKKKEILMLEKQRKRLDVNLGGIADMVDLPGALFIIDPNREYISVNEAKALDIPIIAIIDTNCDPDGINYPVPGNDDSIRAIKLYASKVTDAILEGTRRREENLRAGISSAPPASVDMAATKKKEVEVISVGGDALVTENPDLKGTKSDE